MKKAGCLLFILLLSLTSCELSFSRIEDYLKWMHDTENGLIKEKIAGDKKITVKYLTPEYLTYQELKEKKNYTKKMRDSLLNLYAQNRTFLLTIQQKDDASGDIMMENVEDYTAYAAKATEMNFELGNYIHLNTVAKIYAPVLTSLENTYGLQKHRNVFIVFSKENIQDDLLNSEKLDFVFNDELFNTGISHFIYSKKNIDQKVITNFWNIKETL